MLNIVISFDYELFLGENYASSSKVLFEPTYKLLALLSKYNVTSTFFVDVCSVFAHEKYGLNDYVENFARQLIKMKEMNQDVQLHLHPNWYLSNFVNGKWIFDTSHYTLHKFGFCKTNDLSADKIIREGINYLENLLQPFDQNYKVVAFRAGGYSLQPHTQIVESLRKHGVLIDSSVCRNLYSKTDTLSYDYRKCPRAINWWITPNREFLFCGAKKDGGLFEIPVMSEKNSLFKKVFKPGYDLDFRKEKLNGSFISMNNCSRPRNIFQKAIVYSSSFSLISFDSMPSTRMIDYLISFEKKHRTENCYISIICHPKLVDSGELTNIEKVISFLTKNPNFNLCNFSDVADTLMRQ